MIRIEAEIPRNDLASVADALDMLGITVNISKVKSRGKTVDSEVHAAKGTGMYKSSLRTNSSFRQQFLITLKMM